MSIKHSLLALLSTGPMYGQQLKDEFETRTGELWPLNVGQVYASLTRLERDGLVEGPHNEDGSESTTRPYVITPEGQIELDLWLKAAPVPRHPPRDDLVMKVMISASIDPVGTVEIVQSHRRRLLESMQRFTHLKADPTATMALLLMCDAELFRLEASIRWLDSVDARLRAGQLLETSDSDSAMGPIKAMAPINEGAQVDS